MKEGRRNEGSREIKRENKQKEMVYWSQGQGQGGSDLLKNIVQSSNQIFSMIDLCGELPQKQ